MAGKTLRNPLAETESLRARIRVVQGSHFLRQIISGRERMHLKLNAINLMSSGSHASLKKLFQRKLRELETHII